MDKTVLSTVYRAMGDRTVYDKAWDETEEVLLSTLSTVEDCEFKKIEIAPDFLNSSYEHPPTTAFFLCITLCHRSQMNLFGE